MDPALQNALIFAAVACAGMIAHYVKAWAKGEIAGNLIDYLFRDNVRNTVLAFGGVLAAAATAYITGTLTGLNVQALVLSAFTTGFSLDSTLNKSGTAVQAAPLGSIQTKERGFVRIGLLMPLAALALLACAATPGPKDAAQSIIYVEAATASADSLVSRLYKSGTVTKAEGLKVLLASRSLKAAVADARDLLTARDEAGAQAQLQAVQADLQTITSFLSVHQ